MTARLPVSARIDEFRIGGAETLHAPPVIVGRAVDWSSPQRRGSDR